MMCVLSGDVRREDVMILSMSRDVLGEGVVEETWERGCYE